MLCRSSSNDLLSQESYRLIHNILPFVAEIATRKSAQRAVYNANKRFVFTLSGLYSASESIFSFELRLMLLKPIEPLIESFCAGIMIFKRNCLETLKVRVAFSVLLFYLD